MARDFSPIYVVLEGAEDDAKSLDDDERILWAEAKERLRTNPGSNVSSKDKRITGDGPPILFYQHTGPTRAIVVEYHYVPYKKAVWIIGVDSFPV